MNKEEFVNCLQRTHAFIPELGEWFFVTNEEAKPKVEYGNINYGDINYYAMLAESLITIPGNGVFEQVIFNRAFGDNGQLLPGMIAVYRRKLE